MEKKTDICIVGGGPAGYVAAIRAAQLGAAVILAEARQLGGTCLNRGCIPTKALLKTSEMMRATNRAKEVGLDVSVSGLNTSVVQSRKDRIVRSLRTGLEYLMSKNNIQILTGKGSIKSPKSVTVETEDGSITVSCDKMIVTTGSEPYLPDIPGVELAGVMSSDDALELDNIPESIIIIGAGAIGMEFATYYQSLGSHVTVVELMDSVLPGEDQDITSELLKIMKRQGIKFHLGSRVKEIRKVSSGMETVVENSGCEALLTSDFVLVAVGRRLNCNTAEMESLGIHTKDGAIVVNDRLETSVPGIYAAGDIIGGKLLAHLAFAEGRVAAENAMGMERRLNYNAVPSCVYTEPEMAAVGIGECQANREGLHIKIGRFNLRSNGRALCHGEREGFVKVIVESDTDRIVGARILGMNASEIISELTLAVTLGIKADVLADMIHPHPTLSECVMEACADAAGRAIHK